MRTREQMIGELTVLKTQMKEYTDINYLLDDVIVFLKEMNNVDDDGK